MLVLCFNHPISLCVIYPQVWHVTGHTSVSLSTGFAPWLVSQPQDSERRGGRESVPPHRAAGLSGSRAHRGLRDPIVLHEGTILDGRNRYRACHAAQVPMQLRSFDGADPATWCRSIRGVGIWTRASARRQRRSSQRWGKADDPKLRQLAEYHRRKLPIC
jgi:hypothetical protein